VSPADRGREAQDVPPPRLPRQGAEEWPDLARQGWQRPSGPYDHPLATAPYRHLLFVPAGGLGLTS